MVRSVRSHFDLGWDAWREDLFGRQQADGVIPASAALTPRPEWVSGWDQLTPDEQRMLKVPVVADMGRVGDSFTLPALLLGGDTGERPDEVLTLWEAALRLPNVHGLVAGRNLLYPPDDDVAAAVDVAVSLLPRRQPIGMAIRSESRRLPALPSVQRLR